MCRRDLIKFTRFEKLFGNWKKLVFVLKDDEYYSLAIIAGTLTNLAILARLYSFSFSDFYKFSNKFLMCVEN